MDINSLERFVKAQENVFHIAMEELMRGKKQSHWMWFMFPQLRGLGTSAMAHIYGLSGLEEAIAYLEHPTLSERLLELCGALLRHKDKTACEIYKLNYSIIALSIFSWLDVILSFIFLASFIALCI